MTRFATALKRERLTQGQVAKALGIKRQSVNEWATGRRRIPNARRNQIREVFPDSFPRLADLENWTVYEVRPAKDNYEEVGA